ncbi:MAG TPA: hypothetical protein DCZ49_04185 [Hyphomonadaceae bacterium]|nr:hypothetical protein [Hyphomonadaceae bacterium]
MKSLLRAPQLRVTKLCFYRFYRAVLSLHDKIRLGACGRTRQLAQLCNLSSGGSSSLDQNLLASQRNSRLRDGFADLAFGADRKTFCSRRQAGGAADLANCFERARKGHAAVIHAGNCVTEALAGCQASADLKREIQSRSKNETGDSELPRRIVIINRIIPGIGITVEISRAALRK